MNEIQHPSLKAELLYLIGRASAPPDCSELYEKCELADEIAKVAKALSNLQFDNKIVRVAGEGRSRYKLADGVSAPAPAGKVGRPPIADPDAAPVTTKPTVEIPTLGAPVRLVGKNPGPKPKDKPVEPGLPVVDIPPIEDAEIANGLDQVESALNDSFARTGVDIRECLRGKQPGSDAASLADAIIARLKTDLGPMLRPYIGESIEAETRVAGPSIHVHIDQVDIHLGGL